MNLHTGLGLHPPSPAPPKVITKMIKTYDLCFKLILTTATVHYLFEYLSSRPEHSETYERLPDSDGAARLFIIITSILYWWSILTLISFIFYACSHLRRTIRVALLLPHSFATQFKKKLKCSWTMPWAKCEILSAAQANNQDMEATYVSIVRKECQGRSEDRIPSRPARVPPSEQVSRTPAFVTSSCRGMD